MIDNVSSILFHIDEHWQTVYHDVIYAGLNSVYGNEHERKTKIDVNIKQKFKKYNIRIDRNYHPLQNIGYRAYMELPMNTKVTITRVDAVSKLA